MPNTPRTRSALSAAAVLALAAVCTSCGSDSQVDPYNGVVFASDGAVFALDSRMLASTDRTTCNPAYFSKPPYNNTTTVANCYAVQLGYANGKPIQFYNLDPVIFWSATTNAPPNCSSAASPCTVGVPQNRDLGDASCAAAGLCTLPLTIANKNADNTGGSHADVFPQACVPDSNFDPRTDSYRRTSQGPVFDSLPLATTNTAFTAIVWPVVATYGVSGTSGMTCNDIKDSRSIGSNGAPGKFGAVRTDTPNSYELWPIIDPTATVLPFDLAYSTPVGGSFGPSLGWYKGMQALYLDGGPIPTTKVTDSTTTPPTTTTKLAVMDAVILNGSSFSPVTLRSAIIFPAAPGDEAWSPIVRLNNFSVASGKSVGDYNGICPIGKTVGVDCPSTYLPAASVTFSASAKTIFVVAPRQQ